MMPNKRKFNKQFNSLTVCNFWSGWPYFLLPGAPENERFQCSWAARLLGLQVRIPVGWCLLLVVLCVARDLCIGLITRADKSYQVWCVSVIVVLDTEEALAHWGLLHHKKNCFLLHFYWISPTSFSVFFLYKLVVSVYCWWNFVLSSCKFKMLNQFSVKCIWF